CLLSCSSFIMTSRLPLSTVVPCRLLLAFQRHLRSPLFPYTTLFRSPTRPTAYRSHTSLKVGSSSPMCGGSSGHGGQNCRHTSVRSEEHTSELQSRENLVCRLLLEKKKKKKTPIKIC